MNLQLNIEVRDENNDFVWSDSFFTPKVSKEFISELRTILALRPDDGDRVLNVCGTATNIQDDVPVSC